MTRLANGLRFSIWLKLLVFRHRRLRTWLLNRYRLVSRFNIATLLIEAANHAWTLEEDRPTTGSIERTVRNVLWEWTERLDGAPVTDWEPEPDEDSRIRSHLAEKLADPESATSVGVRFGEAHRFALRAEYIRRRRLIVGTYDEEENTTLWEPEEQNRLAAKHAGTDEFVWSKAKHLRLALKTSERREAASKAIERLLASEVSRHWPKIELNAGTLAIAATLVAGFSVIAGYSYTHFLLASFGLDAGRYYAIDDYITASINQLGTVLPPLAIGLFLRIRADRERAQTALYYIQRDEPERNTMPMRARVLRAISIGFAVFSLAVMLFAPGLIPEGHFQAFLIVTIPGALMLWAMVPVEDVFADDSFAHYLGVVGILLGFNVAMTLDREISSIHDGKENTFRMNEADTGPQHWIASNNSWAFLYLPDSRTAVAKRRDELPDVAVDVPSPKTR